MSTEKKTVDIVVTHVFDAPVEQVWNAWIDPDVIMQWWGPDYFSCPLAKIDFREGGTSLVCMRAPQDFGGADSYNTWVYTKIVPLTKIEFVQSLTDEHGTKLDTSVMNFPSEFPQEVRSRLEFNAIDDHTTELVATEYAWPEGKMVELSRMGLEQCLNKMAVALG